MSTSLCGLGASGLPDLPGPTPDFTVISSIPCDHVSIDPADRGQIAKVSIVNDPFSEPCLPLLPVWLTPPVKMTRQEYVDRLVESIW